MIILQDLPDKQSPEVLGLHENAAITRDLKETKFLFDSVLLAQKREGGHCTDSRLLTIVSDILDKVSVKALVWYGLLWFHITFSDISAINWWDICPVFKYKPAAGHSHHGQLGDFYVQSLPQHRPGT